MDIIKLKKLLEFGLDNDLEIVSFGLAPNPNGFCFESHGEASDHVIRYFSKELDALTSEEIEVLKEWVF